MVVGVWLLTSGSSGTSRDSGPIAAGGGIGAVGADPLTIPIGKEGELTTRATAGEAHVLYAKSPGGVLATAARVAHFRPIVNAAARASGSDPATIEAIVFLESAGFPNALSSNDPAGAVGLSQIVASTATSLLGMHVDLAASRRLTKKVLRAAQRGQTARVRRLQAARRKIDDRFDPAKALAATGRYLQIARARFRRDDLAAESYHMGIGNLEGVIRSYGGQPGDASLAYARLFFDSSPVHHAGTYAMLAKFGDDSSLYWWKVLAAREIMHQYRTDRTALTRTASLQTAKNSAEEVLHPADRTKRFATPAALRAAFARRELDRLPADPAKLGFQVDRSMGALAPKLKQPRTLYRALRPEALAMLEYLAAKVRALGGSSEPLVLTSSVRDERYQKLLALADIEATHAYSLHTTGFAFDVARRYATRAQALAFQFVLDRLTALNLIAWVREPGAIHVVVAGDAARVLHTQILR